MLTENELHIEANHLCPEIINHDITIIQSLVYPEVFDKIKRKGNCYRKAILKQILFC